MKRIVYALLGASLSWGAWANTALDKLTNTHYRDGEQLEYAAYFQMGAIKVDKVSVKTTVQKQTYQGEPVFNIQAVAQTEKTLHTLCSIVDTFQVKLRAKDMAPLWFSQQDHEKKYYGQKEYTFHYTDSSTTIQAYENHNGRIYQDTPTFTGQSPMDACALLFRLRNYDFSHAKAGTLYTFDYFDEGECVPLKLRYMGREDIKLRNGAVYKDCNRFQFEAAEGSLFSEKYPVYLWLTNDPSHTLVHAEGKLKIGSAQIDLVSAK